MRLAHAKPTRKDDYGKYVDGILEKLESAWEDLFSKRLEAEEKRCKDIDERFVALTSALKALEEGLRNEALLIQTVGNMVIKYSDGKIQWSKADAKYFEFLGVPLQGFTLPGKKETSTK
jgi:hypothetical protein